MAKKSSKQHFPVVRQGRLFRQSPAVNARVEVNIERLLSKSNRRLYRHGRNYSVKIDIDPSSTQQYNVYALSDSWMVEKAFEMGYAMYLENSKDERDRLGVQQLARWEDFRTQSGLPTDRLDPIQYNLENIAANPREVLTAGEFADTAVTDAAGVRRNFWWRTAGSAIRYSLLEEYDKAGNAQPAPDTSTTDMPYDDLMADDSATMAADLQTKGNLPPYDETGVNSNEPWIRVGTLQAGASQKLSTGFFTAPCGFVIITADGGLEDAIVDEQALSWTVKAGDYKGVHAPSMLE